ncbi:hypothetical protein [Kitasatospora sp. NPDC050543]|uniref:hypothetical protein n=1 Tax=Kitasatospora sp. NPDC050543 TaxID=3364054 RepID=UPI00378D3D66
MGFGNGTHKCDQGSSGVCRPPVNSQVTAPDVAVAIRYSSRPDVTCLPIEQDPSLRWGLVWRTEAENDLIRGLAHTVCSLGTARL